MWDILRKLRKNETGATGVEYAIVAAVVAVAAISALDNLGSGAANALNTAAGAEEPSLAQNADAAMAQNMGAGTNEAAAWAAADINHGHASDDVVALQ